MHFPTRVFVSDSQRADGFAGGASAREEKRTRHDRQSVRARGEERMGRETRMLGICASDLSQIWRIERGERQLRGLRVG